MQSRDNLMYAYEATLESSSTYQLFRALDVCEALSSQESMMLFSCFNVVVVSADDLLYQAGERSDQMVRLVITGCISVSTLLNKNYIELGAGDTFGLFSFLDEKRTHSACLVAITDAVLLTLDRDYFNLITLEDPVLGNQLLRFMFRLLSRMSLKLETEYVAVAHHLSVRSA
ncbi:MAG: cyclic nucleotide-binding domain-containing protein [Mariprofundus sp.]|nr:cyclic nucleotide-binding domain-containing protein [Mariprofundus sp.]